jgi:hypothetical protein
VFSSAINRVTQIDSNKHYSHIALLEKNGKKLSVLHAGTKNGSERIPLPVFLSRYDSTQTIVVYRLLPEFQHAIPLALKTAKAWLGKPYNYSFILSDDQLYCSDFVQRSFAADSIFELQPMHFCNPTTGKIDEAWTKYYKALNLDVPEGKMGCNPNGLAASKKVYCVGELEKN